MKISGIYKIINRVNGDYYVGSSNTMQKRWNNHRCQLNKGKHINRHLQRAWKKYGGENFDFVIVKQLKEKLLTRTEQKFLDIAATEKKKCYNILFDAENKRGKKNPFYKKHHTKETRKILSNYRLGVSRPNLQDPTLFTFYNIKTKKHVITTKYNFRNRYKLFHIFSLTSGKRNRVGNWICLTSPTDHHNQSYGGEPSCSLGEWKWCHEYRQPCPCRKP